MDKECCQCGNTAELITLLSGQYACRECLDIVRTEQLEISRRIFCLLGEYPSLDKMSNKIKALKAIAIFWELTEGEPNGN